MASNMLIAHNQSQLHDNKRTYNTNNALLRPVFSNLELRVGGQTYA